MIRVLLIGPSAKDSITEFRFVTAPLGVHYIASYLEVNGHLAEVWDLNISTISLKKKMQENWDIIAFSSQESTEEYDMANIYLAKKISPKSILIAGGTGASLNYAEYFNKTPLDMVIQGEGEIPLLKLCNMLEGRSFYEIPVHSIPGVIVRNRAEVLTLEKYWDIRKCLNVSKMRAQEYWNKTAKLYYSPNFDEINTFRLYTSNYCPMDCAFCTLTRLRKYSCGKNTPVIQLTVDQIVYLIKKVLYEYKDCRQIFFVDDDFFLIKQRGIEFCKKIIELRDSGVIPDYLKFICLTNINRIDESNIELIKEAGFRVLSIGVESTSQYVLDSLDKKQTVDRIWKTTKLILEVGIKPYYTLLAWTPFCRIEDLIIDLKGFRQLGSMGVGLSLEQYLIPLKGTRLSEEHTKERVRKVIIKGTDEYIYKGFAWLPMNKEVLPLFNRFENIYPKYRNMIFEKNKGKHLEKNFQAYLILDCIEMVLRESGKLMEGNINNYAEILNKLDSLEQCNVDIVGAITK